PHSTPSPYTTLFRSIQPGHHGLKIADIVGTGLAEPVTPATNLALHITRALAQLVQTSSLGIHPVQVDQFVDHVQAQLAGIRFAQLEILGEILTQNDALEPLHYVEVAAHYTVVLANGDDAGHIRIDRLQGFHHPRLT